jgi:hypothetical protein
VADAAVNAALPRKLRREHPPGVNPFDFLFMSPSPDARLHLTTARTRGQPGQSPLNPR